MKKLFIAHYLFDMSGEGPDAGIIGASTSKDKLEKKVDMFKSKYMKEHDIHEEGGEFTTSDDEYVIFMIEIEEVEVED